jgi:hypothetical protein
MSSLVLALVLASFPLALAALVVVVTELVRRAGVRVPRIMRAGPWRSE